MRRLVTGLAGVLCVVGLGLGLSGCGIGGIGGIGGITGIGASSGTITTSAIVPDVGTLALGAQVKMADVPVGNVTAIKLDGDRAKVTMSIKKGAAVPANVVAKIDRTTVLGERYVDLSVPRHPSGRLANGAPIRRTAVVPTVEQVIGAGSQVFGAISASDLAQMVDAGGQGFSGEAATLRQFLNNLSSVTHGYAAHTAQISTVIESLDQLGTSMDPTSGVDAQAITNLSKTVSVLAANSQKFEALLQSLDGVSAQGSSILSQQYPQIVDQLRALEAVSHQLAAHQQDLAQLLQWLPVHDATMSASVRHNFLQILNNLIVCGIATGGSGATAATTCATTPGAPPRGG